MTRIRLDDGTEAWMEEDGLWHCENNFVRRMLRILFAPGKIYFPTPDPNPAYHAAKAAIDFLGGEILKAPKTEYDGSIVY